MAHLAVKSLDYAFSLKVRAREEEQHEAAAIHLHHSESHSNNLSLISKPRLSDETLLPLILMIKAKQLTLYFEVIEDSSGD